MNTVVRLGAAAVLLVHPTGCDSGPTAPRQSTSPPVPSLTGWVANVVGFSLSGAVVEGVDDQGNRMSTLTDRNGLYELKVPSTGAITVRASREGYVSSERRVDLPQTGPANFVLNFTEQSLGLGGDFRLTLEADAACVQLPAEVRTRAYDASLTPLLADYYEGTLRNAASFVGSFAARVDGGFVSFSANDSEYFVHERLGASAFLTIFFTSGRTPVEAPTYTAPMTGEFEYCGEVSLANQFVCRAPRIRCTSSNHAFTLTRR